jgi:hypothetical protein
LEVITIIITILEHGNPAESEIENSNLIEIQIGQVHGKLDWKIYSIFLNLVSGSI